MVRVTTKQPTRNPNAAFSKKPLKSQFKKTAKKKASPKLERKINKLANDMAILTKISTPTLVPHPTRLDCLLRLNDAIKKLGNLDLRPTLLALKDLKPGTPLYVWDRSQCAVIVGLFAGVSFSQWQEQDTWDNEEVPDEVMVGVFPIFPADDPRLRGPNSDVIYMAARHRSVRHVALDLDKILPAPKISDWRQPRIDDFFKMSSDIGTLQMDERQYAALVKQYKEFQHGS